MAVLQSKNVTKIRFFFTYGGKTKNFTLGDLNPTLSDDDLYDIAQKTSNTMQVLMQGYVRINQFNMNYEPE